MGDNIMNLDTKEEAFIKGQVEEAKSSTTEKSSNVLQQLMNESKSDKEPTVRITVDLPKSMHQELSMFCAKTGKSKAEVIRLLLKDALNTVNQ